MTVKKNAVNISVFMVLASLVSMLICWYGRDRGITAFLFTLASGVFGSGFAALWIFIYEYNQAKQELLAFLFDEVVSVFEKETLPVLDRYGFYDPEIREYLKHRYYMPPVPADAVMRMGRPEQCLYELCRFVDGVLEIGYDRIRGICHLDSQIDFWTDSLRRRNRYRDAVVRRITLPVYEVFLSAPAMEEGYIFRYFRDFQTNYQYTADEIYGFVCELDQAMHGTGGAVKYNWQKRNPTLPLHMHETMWIFRDAFFSPHASGRERRRARRAFLKDTSYSYIR